jgi:hypothetical protein
MQVYHLSGQRRTYLCQGFKVPSPEHPNFRSFGAKFGLTLTELVRADFAIAENTGNASHAVEFYVERAHGSIEEAAAFYFQHAIALRAAIVGTPTVRNGVFVFVSEVGTAESYYYLKGAGLESVTFSEPPVGESTVCTYRILGGRMDTTNS